MKFLAAKMHRKILCLLRFFAAITICGREAVLTEACEDGT